MNKEVNASSWKTRGIDKLNALNRSSVFDGTVIEVYVFLIRKAEKEALVSDLISQIL